MAPVAFYQPQQLATEFGHAVLKKLILLGEGIDKLFLQRFQVHFVVDVSLAALLTSSTDIT